MRITGSQLRQIIKEETQHLLSESEGRPLHRYPAADQTAALGDAIAAARGESEDNNPSMDSVLSLLQSMGYSVTEPELKAMLLATAIEAARGKDPKGRAEMSTVISSMQRWGFEEPEIKAMLRANDMSAVPMDGKRWIMAGGRMA